MSCCLSTVIVDGAENHELAQSPYWDEETASLYFTDVFGSTIHKYIPSTNELHSANVGENVSIIIPVEGNKNKFIVGLTHTIEMIEWDGVKGTVSSKEVIAEVEMDEEQEGNRINTGKCDSSGRLWFGTMGSEVNPGYVEPGKGALYSLEGTTLRKHLDELDAVNGFTFNKNSTKFYLTNSGSGIVEEYNFDVEMGNISNGKTLFSLKKHNIDGLCYGLATDNDDNIWVTIHNGFKLIKISSNKEHQLLHRILIPAKQITSLAFGGNEYKDLYITTGRCTIDDVILTPPQNGSIYKVSGIPMKGIPTAKFNF